MLTHKYLFFKPSNLADSYLLGVKHVQAELDNLRMKKLDKTKTDDYKSGWNDCIIALSKRIKVEKK